MKSVCTLDGNLILRDKKTGVHIYHEMVLQELLNRKLNYEICSAAFDPKSECKNRVEKQDMWIKNHVIFSKFHRIIGYILPIEWIFGKHDIYFCDGFFPHIINRKSKRICLVHDLMVKIYPQNYSILMRTYLNMFFSKLPKADLIVCVSETTKKDIMKYYKVSPDKILVTYSGFKTQPTNIKICPDNKRISEYENFIFYIGDMRPNKNLLNTFKGFCSYCYRNPKSDVVFYIAGKESGEYEKLHDFVVQNKMEEKIIFLGYISENDKQFLYQNGKAVMLVSEYEGFGVPIMEGLVYGTNVITSNCSSMKEIGDGIAILVDPYDVDDIACGIEKACNKKLEIDKETIKRKMSLFSFSYVADVLDKTFNMALENGK